MEVNIDTEDAYKAYPTNVAEVNSINLIFNPLDWPNVDLEQAMKELGSRLKSITIQNMEIRADYEPTNNPNLDTLILQNVTWSSLAKIGLISKVRHLQLVNTNIQDVSDLQENKKFESVVIKNSLTESRLLFAEIAHIDFLTIYEENEPNCDVTSFKPTVDHLVVVVNTHSNCIPKIVEKVKKTVMFSGAVMIPQAITVPDMVQNIHSANVHVITKATKLNQVFIEGRCNFIAQQLQEISCLTVTSEKTWEYFRGSKNNVKINQINIHAGTSVSGRWLNLTKLKCKTISVRGEGVVVLHNTECEQIDFAENNNNLKLIILAPLSELIVPNNHDVTLKEDLYGNEYSALVLTKLATEIHNGLLDLEKVIETVTRILAIAK